ncbi:unnamed protein product [Closterium sp. NIES-53]
MLHILILFKLGKIATVKGYNIIKFERILITPSLVSNRADVPVSREEEVGGDTCDHVADAKWPAISGAEFWGYGQAEVLSVE